MAANEACETGYCTVCFVTIFFLIFLIRKLFTATEGLLYSQFRYHFLSDFAAPQLLHSLCLRGGLDGLRCCFLQRNWQIAVAFIVEVSAMSSCCFPKFSVKASCVDESTDVLEGLTGFDLLFFFSNFLVVYCTAIRLVFGALGVNRAQRSFHFINEDTILFSLYLDCFLSNCYISCYYYSGRPAFLGDRGLDCRCIQVFFLIRPPGSL